MAKHAVGQDHNWIAVLEGQLKGPGCEVAHLLDASRCQNDVVVAAVPSSFAGLIVVRLLRPDVAKARSRPADIDNDAGQLCSGDVGYALLLQAHAGTRGSCKHSMTCGCCPVDHIDCRLFRFRLNELASQPWEISGGFVQYLTGRGDGIAKKAVTTGIQCSDNHSAVSRY